jgi:hypothetical protein
VRFPPSATADGSAHASRRNDRSANMAAIGFEPQYGTRSSGFFGSNSVYGFAV